MKKKKGLLLASETVKIVIALIAITFLIVMVGSIYFNKVKAEKKVQAESVLLLSTNSLEAYINKIRSGGEGDPFIVSEPVGWYVFSFTKDEKPNNCFGENCLCICGNVWLNVFDRQIKECDEDGICLVVEDLKSYSDELEFEITAEKKGLLLLFVSEEQGKIDVKSGKWE
jgi:hypothetical protein